MGKKNLNKNKMSSREEFDFEKDCSIGDLEYDSDMQITRLYVKCFKGKASLKELERLFNYYRGKVLEYLDLTSDMLDLLYRVNEDFITYGSTIEKDIRGGYDTFVSRYESYDIPKDVIDRILNNFSTYFGFINPGNNTQYNFKKFFKEKQSAPVYIPGCMDETDYKDFYGIFYEILKNDLIPYVYDYYNSNKLMKTSWFKFALARINDTMNQLEPSHYRNESLRHVITQLERGHVIDFNKFISDGKKKVKNFNLNLVDIRKEYDEDSYDEKLDYVYRITDCIDMLIQISKWNCASLSEFGLTIGIHSYFYLPNNIGLFGLNTYLYALCNGVYIVGVPSVFPRYDNIEGACPNEFIEHDLFHTANLHQIRERDLVKVFNPIYHKIITDPILTLKQRKVMILSVWILIHEQSWMYFSKSFKNDIVTTVMNTTVVRPVYIEFYSEFNKYRDLILTDEIFEVFKPYLGKYEEFLNKYQKTARLFDMKIHLVLAKLLSTVKTFDDFRDLLDNKDADLEIRGVVFWWLCLYYTIGIVDKYYPDLMF